MQTSETIGKLAEALAKAQGTFPPAKKQATNPHLGSTYADMPAIWEACRQALSENGLAVLQGAEFHDPAEHPTGLTVVTRIVHTSGEWVEGKLFMPFGTKDTRKDEPQAAAAAFSYGRRHLLQAMLGIATADDDAEPSQCGRSQGQEKVESIGLAAARMDMDAITDEKVLIEWYNRRTRDIAASPEKKEINQHFQARKKALASK